MPRILLALLLTACAGGLPSRSVGGPPLARRLPLVTPITHIVVIVQENRTPDNLFQGFPGADTAAAGMNSHGQNVTLVSTGLTAPYDIKHTHTDWKKACRMVSSQCTMAGFDLQSCSGSCPTNAAYGFVPPASVQPYWTMAQQYGFANRMFQTQQGPSFPSHQFIISGTSTIADGSNRRASENPAALNKLIGGCDSPANAEVTTIGNNGNEGQPVFPCFNRKSIFTLLDQAGVPWRYYQANAGSALWNGVDALKPLCPVTPCNSNPEYAANVIVPSAQVLTDIGKGNLAAVTFVTPTFASSDHAGVTDGSGPDWVASIVNAIGQSPYWDSTAILATWDDWGGWYDHVQPPLFDSYTDGFRVPLLVISPYAIPSYVSNTQHEFGSILKFIEETFNTGSLGTTDVRADDLGDFFNYGQAPIPFQVVPSHRKAAYFLAHARTNQIVDKD